MAEWSPERGTDGGRSPPARKVSFSKDGSVLVGFPAVIVLCIRNDVMQCHEVPSS